MSQTVSITVCPTCNKALELIEQSKPNCEIDPAAFLDSLHLLFEGALHHLLSEIDYEAHPHSNSAIAARLMAVGVERMTRLMPLTEPRATRGRRTKASAGALREAKSGRKRVR